MRSFILSTLWMDSLFFFKKNLSGVDLWFCFLGAIHLFSPSLVYLSLCVVCVRVCVHYIGLSFFPSSASLFVFQM